MSKILDLVAFAKTDTTNEQKEVVLGNVANFQAQEINKITGVKINGAKRIITLSGIRHAIKEHGNNKEQIERGQIGIIDSDFELIQDILNRPDRLVKGNDKRGKKSIMFIRLLGIKEYYIAMSLHPSKEDVKIIFNTMYIKKKADVN